MRVLNVDDLGFPHPGGHFFMTYLSNKEALASQGEIGRAHRARPGRPAMNYPLQALIQMGVVPPVNFPTDSRYYRYPTLQYTCARRHGDHLPGAALRAAAGRAELCHRRAAHGRQGDRLDLIAAKYLGDPLMFWLICDANGAIAPDDLVATPGRVLDITTPQGVPGVSTGARCSRASSSR